MLKEWPVANLFWWSCLPEPDSLFGQKVAAHRVALIPRKLYPQRRWCGAKSWFLEHVWTPWAARHFETTLDEFNPEAVWVIAHGWAIPPLARALPRTGIGFHTTVQDYMDAKVYVARFGSGRSQRLVALAEKLYSEATTRDATSQPMVADLEARTGRTAGQILHAGLEAEDFAFLAGKKQSPAQEIRIAYSGTIIVEEDFAWFAKLLDSVRPRLPVPVKLQFFGARAPLRHWFNSGWMREHGLLAQEPLLNAMKECTWGFVPMSMADDNPRYNRFSFPTKFISCLAAGLPLITMGHPESAVVQMANTYRVGICLSSGEPDALAKELLTGLSIKDPWERFKPEILRCASSEFNAGQKRNRLYECLLTCARKRLA
jgi:hypothetical protein